MLAGYVGLVGAAASGMLRAAWGEWVTNATAFALGTAMFVVLAIRVGKNLHRLAILEPRRV